ncbi:NADPH:quinone reductase-like Zn-dependent oxidoreductase [Mesorhizobium sp. J18]|uniref:NADPH:quinone oxidoreductase family protein n=1 Tax=Mesorhizobium sp. J18 TaxID=935263 RepID=UPI001199241D|nr:NADPH:quinone oxidoreductase family protein [Mesorhizobium sp. J18]TWG94834.1 NADPH:quinone reductase-like Zn-dependent oxidoreductase [Mesorhizobium sp. J18]
MKAIVARDFAPLDKLEYADWPEPEAKGDAVVIGAEAIGVNYPDGLLVQGLYQMRPETPFVPGMEVAGKVLAVGDKVASVKPGDRVAALMTHGAYAEKVAVPEATVMKLPDGIGNEDACALICGYGTAHHALKQRGELKPGETLCVLGASGATGVAAVQIGKAMGAKVIGVASTEEKRRVAGEAGADIVIGYENLKDELKRLTDGKGVDVAFDPVGGESFDALSRSMGWKGRLLIIGFASGTIPKFSVNLALVKGFSLVGVFWGSFTQREPEVYAENMKELIGWHIAGKVKPVIEGTYPLAQAPEVLKRVLGRGATGKLILKP